MRLRYRMLAMAMFCPALEASVCAPVATLNTLVALGGAGCTVDATPDSFILKDFQFTVVSSSGIVPATAADITVALALPANFVNISFTSNMFSVTGNQSVSYRIGYTIDPRPVILIGLDHAMFTLTPVAPGTADSTVGICAGAAFTGASCLGLGVPYSTNTFHHGTTSSLTDGVRFAAAVNIIGVRAGIDLRANGASSSIAGIGTNIAELPEPATLFSLGAGLGLLLARRYFAAR